MSYRYRRSEELGPGTRRIAREVVEEALRVLNDPEISAETAIHESRKAIKKLRGLLRLVRPVVVADSMFVEGVRFLRGAARSLGPFRDSDVMTETLDILTRGDGGDAPLGNITLAPPKAAGAKLRKARAAAIVGLINDLLEFRKTIAAWKFDATSLAALKSGYEVTRTSARKQMYKALEEPTDKRLHDWRKHVKYHNYHTRLLANLYGGKTDTRKDKVDRLQDLLGRHHDFAVLRETVKAGPPAGAGRDTIRALRKRIKQKSRSLENDARDLGQELF